MQTLTIRRPDDFHFHPRRGLMLSLVLPFTSAVFARGVPMPNTKPEEILTGPGWLSYQREIKMIDPNFEPIGAIKITDDTTPAMIDEAAGCSVKVCKFYPIGTTTGSETGVSDFDVYRLRPLLMCIRNKGLIASFHCEKPNEYRRYSEAMFLPILDHIIDAFTDLLIIIEHASTRETIELVKRAPSNVAATLTPHHMWYIYEDVFTNNDIYFRNPHNYCRPVCNSESDRQAVIEAAISGNPKFFFGSDSAPHPMSAKICDNPKDVKAGVFNAPVALPLLAQIFEEYNALDRLEDFVSRFGAEFYKLPLNEGAIELIKKPWQVPYDYENIGIFYGGQTINWQIT